MGRMAKKKTPAQDPFDGSRFVNTAELGYQQITRMVQTIAFEQRISQHEMGMLIETREFQDHAAQYMVRQLLAKVASKKLDVKTVKFPDGPWQFLKFNLIGSPAYGLKIVRWFLKKYPVRYIEITMEANAYHPDIAIPDRATFVEIMVNSRRDRY